jgi:hypothetical protein
MAVHNIHGRVAAQAAQASTELATKGQVDTAQAAAQNRANHNGTQTAATISDLQAFVDGRVQLVVDAAPSALDTLNELAAALGDDPNFSATVTTQLNGLDSRLDALEAAGGTSNFKQTIGDAAASTFTVTHNLGTSDVAVTVREVASGQIVYPVVTVTGANTVSVDFGSFVPATGSHRVVVAGY